LNSCVGVDPTQSKVEYSLVIGSFSTSEKNCCDEQENERKANVRVREEKSVAKEAIVSSMLMLTDECLMYVKGSFL